MDEHSERYLANKKIREELAQTFIEIDPPSNDDFLKIKETLTRIGIANPRKKVLTQTAHILHKKGQYYIVHFKQLFSLDAAKLEILEQEDQDRLTLISALLEEWGMCKIKNKKEVISAAQFSVIRHAEKSNWKLISKYSVGGTKVESRQN